jgi:hypothetical protein
MVQKVTGKWWQVVTNNSYDEGAGFSYMRATWKVTSIYFRQLM